MVDSENILKELAEAKVRLEDLEEAQQTAKLRQATAQAQLASLTKKLQELTGSVEWSELQTHVAEAAINAQKAIEALSHELNEAGIES